VFCRFGHLAVLVIDKYRYSENIFPREIKIFHHTGKSTISVTTFVFSRFPYGEKSPGGAKEFVYFKVANFGDFPPKI
jgi:hypothetical protein